MNLLQALQSGRPFKLPGQYWLIARQGKLYEESSGRIVTLHNPADMISEEWVTKDPETFLTEPQFRRIWDRITLQYKGQGLDKDTLYKLLCEELGLRKDKDEYEKNLT